MDIMEIIAWAAGIAGVAAVGLFAYVWYEENRDYPRGD